MNQKHLSAQVCQHETTPHASASTHSASAHAPHAAPPVFVLAGAALDLTHWRGNKTPESLYADTSTEIALNFLRRGAPGKPAGPLVVNNHFDSDGALAVWALLNPEEALRHEQLLIEAASAGDFNEWPQAPSMGVELNAALEVLSSECGDDAAKAYDVVLPQISALLQTCAVLRLPFCAHIAAAPPSPLSAHHLPRQLRSLRSREDLWGARIKELEDGLQRVKDGRVRCACVVAGLGASQLLSPRDSLGRVRRTPQSV